MQLRDLQHHWKNYIFQQETDLIKPLINAPAEQGLKIYVDAYEARLLEVMEKIFPRLRAIAGEESFDDAVIQYLIANPSTYNSIAQIGNKFSAYLKSVLKNSLYADIAAIEWAVSEAIDAADAAPLTQVQLQAIAQEKWERIIFELHPSLELLVLESDALKLYQENSDQVHLEYCRIWRKGTQVYYLGITETEYHFLKDIQQKMIFGEVCENLGQVMSEEKAVAYAIGQLQRWLSDELLIKASVSE